MVASLFALAVVTAAQTASSSGTAEPMKLGVEAGLTGASNTIGVPFVNGAKMAAADINKKGGIKGRKVNLVIADTETQAIPSVQAALKLVDVDKVNAIVCSCYTFMMFPISEALKNKNIVIASNAASSPVIRDMPGNIVSTIATDEVLGTRLAQFAYGLKFRNAALLTGNDTYGDVFRKIVGDAYKKLGGKIAIDMVVDLSLPDYGPEMKRIVDSGATTVLMGTYTNDARLQFRQLRKLGWGGVAFKLYPSATLLDQDPEANRHFFGVDNVAVDDAKGKAWAARYQRVYGQAPTIWAAVGYDSTYITALGVGHAKGKSAKAIKNAMRAQSANYRGGPTGPVEFDKTWVRIKPNLAFYTLLNGKYVRVNEKGKIIK